MVDKVSYIIYFVVEQRYSTKKWLYLFVMAAVMIILWIFLVMGLVLPSLLLGGRCSIL